MAKKHRSHRWVAVAVAGLLASVGFSGVAQGDTVTYFCGGEVAPNSWCSSGLLAQWNEVTAHYPGSGTVQVGVRVVWGSGIYRRLLGNNRVDETFPYTYGTAEVANASDYQHQINGAATYCIHSSLDPGCPVVTRRAAASLGAPIAAPLAPSGVAPAMTADGEDYYVEQDGDDACVVESDDAGTATKTCAPVPADPNAVGTILAEDHVAGVADGSSRVFGIAPAGATEVVVELNDEVTTAPVTNGVFVTTVNSPATGTLSAFAG